MKATLRKHYMINRSEQWDTTIGSFPWALFWCLVDFKL